MKALHYLTAKTDGTVAEAEWGGGFTSLEILSLEFNLLTGQLPLSWAYGFGNLTQMYLDGNQLTGNLPAGKHAATTHGLPRCVQQLPTCSHLKLPAALVTVKHASSAACEKAGRLML